MSNILYAYPALVTWCAMALYFWSMARVGGARGKYKVQPPCTDGPEEFRRVFRAQQNTLEQLVLFLPSLWLFALYISPVWAAVLGAVWVVARVWYVLGYSQAAEKRRPPFIFAMVTTVVLLGGALFGIIGAVLVI